MIQITREDSEVKVNLSNGPLDAVYAFSFTCANKWYAALLTTHFNNRLSSLIEQVRKEEYERGYKDGRQKQTKKTWFYSSLKTGI